MVNAAVTSNYSDQNNPTILLSDANYTALGAISSDILADSEIETFNYDKQLGLENPSSNRGAGLHSGGSPNDYGKARKRGHF